ncbi:MAG TPA: NADH-quinone oxidoreductase subunit M, partial [Anaerolineae bacterium]|nr:NADH-quinone oxidoreductase subunit M [Anaerolineae bacterium]
MDLLRNSVLTLIVFLPTVGAIVVALLPKEKEDLIKKFAIWWSAIPLLLSIWMAIDYAMDYLPGNQMAYQVNVPWIPSIGVNYHVGVDGLSVPLVFLTALLTTLGLYYSARVIRKRVKEFFALFLF